MTRTLPLVAIVLAISGVHAEETTPHPWPFAPTDRAHEISNHFCAPLRFGEPRGYLHGGIDIRKPAGTPVLAVAEGTVWVYREGHLDNLVLTEANGDSWEYRHLWADRVPPEVRRAMERGTIVPVGTVLGEVAPWGLDYSHLHFNHRKADGTIVDPLSALLPFPDSIPPSIRAIHVVPADRNTPFAKNSAGAIEISGDVDLVVDAIDTIARATWKHSPRRVRASLVSATGHRTEIATWHPFDTVLPRPPSLPVPRYPRGAGLDGYQRFGPLATSNTIPIPSHQRFSIVVTNARGESATSDGAWNTRAFPDGDYTVEVEAEDAAGNRAESSVAIAIRNATPPPLPPEPAEDALIGALRRHAFATCFAGDRVTASFVVPLSWREQELIHSTRLEIIGREEIRDAKPEVGLRLTVMVDTTGVSRAESFKILPLRRGGGNCTFVVEVSPLIEVAPHPRLRRDFEGNRFLQVRLRTPASTSCLKASWRKGEETGEVRVGRHGLHASNVHCMMIEVIIPESALGGTMQFTMMTLDRIAEVEAAIPAKIAGEEL